MNMPTVALVVLTFNGVQYMPALLESIWAQTLRDCDVVFVDNASTDGTADYLELQRTQGFGLVRNSFNRGCATGWNIGARQCHEADVICLLNQDIVLDPRYAEEVQKAFHDDPSLGAVQPLVRCLGNIDLVENCGHTADAWFNTQTINHGTAFCAEAIPQYPLLTLTAPAIDRRLFERIHGLDEELFIYYEDTDLSVRIWRAGRTIRFLHTAVVDHDREAASQYLSDQMITFLFARNRLRLLWKHADDPRGIARVVSMAVGMGLAGAVNSALSGPHGGALLEALWWNARHFDSNRRARLATKAATEERAWARIRGRVLSTRGVLRRLAVRLRVALGREVQWRWRQPEPTSSGMPPP